MLTPEERIEMENPKKDPHVKLATQTLNKSQDPERKRLYQLRWLKKKGKQIAEELEREFGGDE